jgi:hypothetical protein
MVPGSPVSQTNFILNPETISFQFSKYKPSASQSGMSSKEKSRRKLRLMRKAK